MSNQTRLILKSFKSEIKDPFQTDANNKSVYLGAHNNGKTTYDFEVSLSKVDNDVFASINLGEPRGATEKQSLRKLSEWMKRAAETIDNHIVSGEL